MFIKDNQLIIDKIKELCAVLLEQDAYEELRNMISDFENDEFAIEQYKCFASLQQAKEDKEEQGLELTKEEREAFDQKERAVYSNPVIRKYLFAKKEFENLTFILGDYINKTIEMGRLPNPKELKKVTRGCGTHNQ